MLLTHTTDQSLQPSHPYLSTLSSPFFTLPCEPIPSCLLQYKPSIATPFPVGPSICNSQAVRPEANDGSAGKSHPSLVAISKDSQAEAY